MMGVCGKFLIMVGVGPLASSNSMARTLGQTSKPKFPNSRVLFSRIGPEGAKVEATGVGTLVADYESAHSVQAHPNSPSPTRRLVVRPDKPSDIDKDFFLTDLRRDLHTQELASILGGSIEGLLFVNTVKPLNEISEDLIKEAEEAINPKPEFVRRLGKRHDFYSNCLD